MNRRKFIETIPILSLLNPTDISFLPTQMIGEKIQWNEIKDAFPSKGSLIHLNSGSAGTMTLSTEQFVIASIKELNRHAPYKIWETWQETMQGIKKQLASIINVDFQQIALNRNATDGLNAIIFGFKLKRRHSILAAKHDYPFTLQAIAQRKVKDSIRSKILDIDLDTMMDEEICDRYDKAMTSDVKLVVLTLLTHREGRVLPVQEITRRAKMKGISVLVDGAQAFAHFDHDVAALGCDFYVTSLHKWLNAPLGTGMIYVSKNMMNNVSPPLARHPDSKSMQKFEYLGTSAFHQWVGIISALDFLEIIGMSTKEKRLIQLTQYWTKRMEQEAPQFLVPSRINTGTYKGIAAFYSPEFNISALRQKLYDNYSINTKIVKALGGNPALRISPNVFTLEEELDQFIDATLKISKG